MNEELKNTQVETEVEEQNMAQKEAEEAPIKTLMQSLNEKFDNSANITKKIIVLIAVFIGLLCGYGIGKIGMVEKDMYNKAILSYQELKTDYDTYKEKMQPYEAQQEADVKAAEEAKAKKEAEEKAKKEAEEKAKREAEEKAKKEAEEKARKEAEEKAAQAKAQSLGGITATDFYNSFNGITASNGYDAFLGKINQTNDYISYTTLNPDITMSVTTNNNYLQTVAINAKRTTSESLTEASYYMLATALVIDPTLSNNTVDSLLMSALQGAIGNAGQDYKVSNNGIDYTINVNDSSVFVFYSKSR